MTDQSGETSSKRHGLRHDYGELGAAFPGSMSGHGATAQQIHVEPEILAEGKTNTVAIRMA